MSKYFGGILGLFLILLAHRPCCTQTSKYVFLIFCFIAFCLSMPSVSAQYYGDDFGEDDSFCMYQIDTIENHEITITQEYGRDIQYKIKAVNFSWPSIYMGKSPVYHSKLDEMHKISYKTAYKGADIKKLSNIIFHRMSKQNRQRASGKKCLYSISLSKEQKLLEFSFTIQFKDEQSSTSVFTSRECITIYQKMEKAKLFNTWNNDIGYVSFHAWFKFADKKDKDIKYPTIKN